MWLSMLLVVLGAAQDEGGSGLTRIDGIRVGHHTLEERPTGCTVVLTEKGAVASVDVRGSAPGRMSGLPPTPRSKRIAAGTIGTLAIPTSKPISRSSRKRTTPEAASRPKALPPDNTIACTRSTVLTGSSRSVSRVPGADCGYKAAEKATAGKIAEGNVGAGAGATVGKSAGSSRAMKAGIGSAAIELPNGLIVAALMAVNAVGDVIDPATGEVVAGVRTEDGTALADVRKLLRSGALIRARRGRNTTIGVVATNAPLTKTQANKVAQMANDGLARAIYPAHTPFDGDAIFALALGGWSGDVSVSLSMIGALAAEATSDAILSAVRHAESIAGFPAATELR